ncbi:receptor-like protein EIX1 [Vitis riparia]|uniref:receptor-like protein EIX1 n=1 Tax=Vitis riparia TaxID=96939 RepID=UPI00155B1D14|nr:receptor-like protein EIX1 [Vitis riparia]
MAISKAMTVFPLLCFLFSTISTFSHQNTLVCNETEKRALLSFKHALSDPGHCLSSWFSQEDCCGWNGVYCHNITGRVVKLDLKNPHGYNFSLGGKVSPALLQLEFLNYLDLSQNDFGGTPIPSFLGSMQSLTYLDLHLASFGGLIPPQLGNLSNLQHLSLGGGDSLYEPQLYVENLGWISHLSSLEYLFMYKVDLQREVHWLESTSMLSSLSELYLVACELDNMSPSLGYVNFTSLTFLSLPRNHFNHEIPHWLFNLSTSHIPLNGLDLSNNQLTGQIPEYLGNLSSLTSLSLNRNRLNGPLPSSLGLLSNLEDLVIGNNSLEGTISEVHFNKLSKLKYLDMSSTSLIFKVKSNWVPPFQLERMWMSSCQMGPNFPTWLETQTSLQYLDISKSGIVDIAPKWFWKWASHIDRQLIDLSDNQISGNLSGVLLNNPYIDLSSNCFMGELPRLSPQVSRLNMANNSFSGPISPFLCQKLNGKSNLEILDMSTNNLSGELSHCWAYWQSLTRLNLGNNNLSGKIPDSMGSLFELKALHLHNNSLSGDIPPSLRNCTSLGSWI